MIIDGTRVDANYPSRANNGQSSRLPPQRSYFELTPATVCQPSYDCRRRKWSDPLERTSVRLCPQGTCCDVRPVALTAQSRNYSLVLPAQADRSCYWRNDLTPDRPSPVTRNHRRRKTSDCWLQNARVAREFTTNSMWWEDRRVLCHGESTLPVFESQMSDTAI